MKSSTRMRTILLTAVAGLTLSVAACGTSSGTTTGSSDGSSSAAATTTESQQTTTEAAAAGQNFGSGCAAVPTSGPGSFQGMTADPVAAAASNNPVLSTLVAAVSAAKLVDTLNDPNAQYTVFAPANSAFDAIPEADLNNLLADVPALTDVLTYHVLPMRLSPDQLAGTFKTVEGKDLTISGSGESFTVGDGGANVVCGNVQTANATVYIIDQVLSPPAS